MSASPRRPASRLWFPVPKSVRAPVPILSLEVGSLEQAREACAEKDLVVGHDDATAGARPRSGNRRKPTPLPGWRDPKNSRPPDTKGRTGRLSTRGHLTQASSGSNAAHTEKGSRDVRNHRRHFAHGTGVARDFRIMVRLLWSRSTNLVTVAVDDAANDDYFELILDERDRALDVFHHPFSHAAARGIEFRTGRPELLLEAASSWHPLTHAPRTSGSPGSSRSVSHASTSLWPTPMAFVLAWGMDAVILAPGSPRLTRRGSPRRDRDHE